MPKISIITCCYNSEKYLNKAINSISKQSFNDFECILINDGSTDQTADILEKWRSKDQRIRVIHNPHNMGISVSANKGIELSDCTFLARFDADDIMHTKRLEMQLAYIEKHNLDILGSNLINIGRFIKSKTHYPIPDKAIRALMLFQSPFAQPSILLRRSSLGDQRYNIEMKYAEDYDLWERMSATAKMGNIPEYLLYYRNHPRQISNTYKKYNREAGIVRLNELRKLNIKASPEQEKIHKAFRSTAPYSEPEELVEIEKWLLDLGKQINQEAFYSQIRHEWYLCCIRATHFGLWTWRRYSQSPLMQHTTTNWLKDKSLLMLCFSKVTYQSKTYHLLNAL